MPTSASLPDPMHSAPPDGPLTLALIGAGKAGRSLAAAAVRAGHRVMLEDVLPSRLREALEVIPVDGMPGTLVTVSTVEDAVREADLVIDFVPDELESKLEIVCMADRMAPPKTVLCIQTKALSVTDLASCTYRPERCHRRGAPSHTTARSWPAAPRHLGRRHLLVIRSGSSRSCGFRTAVVPESRARLRTTLGVRQVSAAVAAECLLSQAEATSNLQVNVRSAAAKTPPARSLLLLQKQNCRPHRERQPVQR